MATSAVACCANDRTRARSCVPNGPRPRSQATQTCAWWTMQTEPHWPPPAPRCDAIVHLVGIIREGASASFRDAHERPAEALAHAGPRRRGQAASFTSASSARPPTRTMPAWHPARAPKRPSPTPASPPSLFACPWCSARTTTPPQPSSATPAQPGALPSRFGLAAWNNPSLLATWCPPFSRRCPKALRPAPSNSPGRLRYPRRELIAAAARALDSNPVRVLFAPTLARPGLGVDVRACDRQSTAHSRHAWRLGSRRRHRPNPRRQVPGHPPDPSRRNPATRPSHHRRLRLSRATPSPAQAWHFV